MAVPVPVTVVVVLLCGALLVTSAVLVYKLRPGRRSSRAKLLSPVSDDEKVPPVRKLVIVRGKAVTAPSTPRIIDKFARLSLFSSVSSIHISRPGTSGAYNGGNTRPLSPVSIDIEDVKDSRTTRGPVQDVEKQMAALGSPRSEKAVLYSIMEQSSPEQPQEEMAEARSQKSVKSSKSGRSVRSFGRGLKRKSSSPMLMPDALVVSSWATYNGHRPLNDDLASPIGPISPSLQKSISMAAKMEEKLIRAAQREIRGVTNPRSQPVLSPAKSKVHATSRRAYPHHPHPPPPPPPPPPVLTTPSSSSSSPEPPPPLFMSGKAIGKRPMKPNLRGSGVDSRLMKSASITAKPTSAYSPNPTPPKSSSSETAKADKPNSGLRSTSSKKAEASISSRARVTSQGREPLQLDIKKSTPLTKAFSLPIPPLSAKPTAASIAESIAAATDLNLGKRESRMAAPPAPVSRYSRSRAPTSKRDTRSRARSRSDSRQNSLSRSRSRSRSRSKSRSQKQSRKQRPPPISVSSVQRNLPTVIQTSEPDQKKKKKFVDASPNPKSESTEDKDTENLGGGASSRDSGQLLTSPLSRLAARSHSRSAKDKRLSQLTVASSNYSPPATLASIQRIPLYPGKGPRMSFLGKKPGSGSGGSKGSDEELIVAAPAPTVKRQRDQQRHRKPTRSPRAPKSPRSSPRRGSGGSRQRSPPIPPRSVLRTLYPTAGQVARAWPSNTVIRPRSIVREAAAAAEAIADTKRPSRGRHSSSSARDAVPSAINSPAATETAGGTRPQTAGSGKGVRPTHRSSVLARDYERVLNAPAAVAATTTTIGASGMVQAPSSHPPPAASTRLSRPSLTSRPSSSVYSQPSPLVGSETKRSSVYSVPVPAPLQPHAHSQQLAAPQPPPPRRSRYSHLFDKALPPPPPLSESSSPEQKQRRQPHSHSHSHSHSQSEVPRYRGAAIVPELIAATNAAMAGTGTGFGTSIAVTEESSNRNDSQVSQSDSAVALPSISVTTPPRRMSMSDPRAGAGGGAGTAGGGSSLRSSAMIISPVTSPEPDADRSRDRNPRDGEGGRRERGGGHRRAWDRIREEDVASRESEVSPLSADFPITVKRGR